MKKFQKYVAKESHTIANISCELASSLSDSLKKPESIFSELFDKVSKMTKREIPSEMSKSLSKLTKAINKYDEVMSDLDNAIGELGLASRQFENDREKYEEKSDTWYGE